MNRYQFPSRQSGAALLVALIMLLISTMVGLASMRGTTMNEKMSSNMYDRSLSYQAAEAALLAGEAAVLADPELAIVIDCTVVNAECPPSPATTFTSTTIGWTTVDADFEVNDALLGSTPQFYVEKMGVVGGTDELGLGESANCSNYAGCDEAPPNAASFRITGRSGIPATDGRSVVALQITVKQNL
jgi:type IV pilus assembly protein PilX